MRTAFIAVTWVFGACSGAPQPLTDAGTQGGGSAAVGPEAGGRDAGIDLDAGGASRSDGGGQPQSFSFDRARLEQRLDESLKPPAALPGYVFSIYSASSSGEPELVYQRSDGTLLGGKLQVPTPAAPSVVVRLASASKWLTGLTILRAATLAPAELSLTTTAETLRCTGVSPELERVTVRGFLELTAGLDEADHLCIQRPNQSLRDCACAILRDSYRFPPAGGSFVYGANHFVVAAAIAEAGLQRAQQGADFRAHFDRFRQEVGVPAAEVELPPAHNYAGGFTASARAYAAFLTLALAGASAGIRNSIQLIDPRLLSAFEVPFADEVALAFSPFVAASGFEVRYGLGAWVQCSDPWQTPSTWPAPTSPPLIRLDYAQCPKRVVHSLGKMGFMPWMSRTASGRPYLAVLATVNDGPGRVSMNSFATFQMLDPVLAEAR